MASVVVFFIKIIDTHSIRDAFFFMRVYLSLCMYIVVHIVLINLQIQIEFSAHTHSLWAFFFLKRLQD